MSAANVELARRGYEALVRGDLDAIAELLAPDVRWHAGDPDAEGACQGRAQALAWIHRPERQGPGRLVDVIDAGDKVLVLLEAPDEAAGGGAVRLRGQVSTFRDGKVVEMVGYATPADAFAAAGLPVPA